MDTGRNQKISKKSKGRRNKQGKKLKRIKGNKESYTKKDNRKKI